MSIESAYIWMDGEFVPFHDAKVHILSHSLHYGLGVFEGIRSYEQPGGGGGVFKLDEHLRRLLDSAKMCRMDVQYSLEELREACLATLAKNRLERLHPTPRPPRYGGHGPRGAEQPGAHLGDRLEVGCVPRR